jgi:hypothetical protein
MAVTGDAARLAAEFRLKAATIERDVGRVNLRTAEKIADGFRANVPRLTGATAASAGVNDTGTDAEATIAGAAVFLEYGTSRMAPRPFMGQSITPVLERHVEALADAADL